MVTTKNRSFVTTIHVIHSLKSRKIPRCILAPPHEVNDHTPELKADIYGFVEGRSDSITLQED